jgi:hypothetical protein
MANDLRSESARRAGEPSVGIFWSVNGRLVIDSVLLSEAESYGQFRNYPGGHDKTWRMFQRIGTVPRDVEYDYPPRGRVVFDTLSERFILYADRCILYNKPMLNQIRNELRLPENTKINLDEHYSCRALCLRRSAGEE